MNFFLHFQHSLSLVISISFVSNLIKVMYLSCFIFVIYIREQLQGLEQTQGKKREIRELVNFLQMLIFAHFFLEMFTFANFFPKMLTFAIFTLLLPIPFISCSFLIHLIIYKNVGLSFTICYYKNVGLHYCLHYCECLQISILIYQ